MAETVLIHLERHMTSMTMNLTLSFDIGLGCNAAAAARRSLQSCRLMWPIASSPPGSAVWDSQARTLVEFGISFSVRVCSGRENSFLPLSPHPRKYCSLIEDTHNFVKLLIFLRYLIFLDQNNMQFSPSPVRNLNIKIQWWPNCAHSYLYYI